MLTKLMFFITAVSPLASYGISTLSSSNSINIWTSLIGPAEKGKSEELELHAQYADTSNTSILTVFPYIYVTNGVHNIEYVENLERYGTLYGAQTANWTFTFNYDDYDKASYYKITIYLIEKGTNNVVAQTPTEVLYINGGTYNMKNSVEPQHLYFQYSSLEDYEFNWESYNFSKLSGGLSPESSNELNYTDTFMYDPGDLGAYDESLFKNAYIAVVDYANLYPNITKDLGEYTFRLDVGIDRPSVDYDNMNVSLASLSSDKYYVNKSTLEMYSGAKPLSDNYQETTSFYIPRGKQEEAANNEYILVLEGVGYNKATLYKYLTYYTSKEHFGANCVTSEYCVIGNRHD